MGGAELKAVAEQAFEAAELLLQIAEAQAGWEQPAAEAVAALPWLRRAQQNFGIAAGRCEWAQGPVQ